MATWIFEPGHTAINFRARHMMVTWVRGAIKDVHGKLEFDWDSCLESTFEGRADLTKLWSGEPARDEHLRSADFFDVETHPELAFSGRFTERFGDRHFRAVADVTIRGKTKPVEFDVSYLGEWTAPWWDGDENKGDMRRTGFHGRTRINRHDFGVSWQDELPGGGVVAGHMIDLDLDMEGILLDDLRETGADSYYREDVEAFAKGS